MWGEGKHKRKKDITKDLYEKTQEIKKNVMIIFSHSDVGNSEYSKKAHKLAQQQAEL